MGDDLVTQIDKHWWEQHCLTREEIQRLTIWYISHLAVCTKDYDIIIAQSSKSGIGTNTVIRCGCGAGKDITDYGSW
jgi:hypothetical protein